MPRIPTPLTWKRSQFAVLEPWSMAAGGTGLVAIAVSGIVSGPFAIYASPLSGSAPFTLIHLPSQARIVQLRMQLACKSAAEELARLDLNWWTCDPEEVIGPDLQEMRNIHARHRPPSWLRCREEG